MICGLHSFSWFWWAGSDWGLGFSLPPPAQSQPSRCVGLELYNAGFQILYWVPSFGTYLLSIPHASVMLLYTPPY